MRVKVRHYKMFDGTSTSYRSLVSRVSDHFRVHYMYIAHRLKEFFLRSCVNVTSGLLTLAVVTGGGRNPGEG